MKDKVKQLATACVYLTIGVFGIAGCPENNSPQYGRGAIEHYLQQIKERKAWAMSKMKKWNQEFGRVGFGRLESTNENPLFLECKEKYRVELIGAKSRNLRMILEEMVGYWNVFEFVVEEEATMSLKEIKAQVEVAIKWEQSIIQLEKSIDNHLDKVREWLIQVSNLPSDKCHLTAEWKQKILNELEICYKHFNGFELYNLIRKGRDEIQERTQVRIGLPLGYYDDTGR